MNRSNLEELLRRTPGSRGHTPDCPPDVTLTAALDGGLEPGRREAFDRHVAECDHCVGRLGQLARLSGQLEYGRVPDTTLARARRIPARTKIRRQAPRWAAAAVLVLAIAFTFDRFTPGPDGVEGPHSPTQQVRTIDPNAFRPGVLYPPDGAVIEMDGPLFRWSETPGSLHYDVRVVSVDGAMIWQEQTESTEWRLPPHLQLAAGEEYYFRVDAYLTEAKRVSSPHVLFKVKEQP